MGWFLARGTYKRGIFPGAGLGPNRVSHFLRRTLPRFGDHFDYWQATSSAVWPILKGPPCDRRNKQGMSPGFGPLKGTKMEPDGLLMGHSIFHSLLVAAIASCGNRGFPRGFPVVIPKKSRVSCCFPPFKPEHRRFLGQLGRSP